MFVSYQRFSKSDLDIECSVCIDLEQYLTNVAKSMSVWQFTIELLQSNPIKGTSAIHLSNIF